MRWVEFYMIDGQDVFFRDNKAPHKKLMWRNICRSQCPLCNKKLDFESDPTMMMCTISCGFMISVDKMKLICTTMNLKRINRVLPVDNFSTLQHLGEKEREIRDPDLHLDI